MDLAKLIQKYEVSGPRYTSYPTAPQWSTSIGPDQYLQKLREKDQDKDRSFGIYVHLPFCESLCYYCGCNIQITKDKSRSETYVDAVVREIESVAQASYTRRKVVQMSWGGGTPSFLSVNEINTLGKALHNNFEFSSDADISIEIDPRVTNQEQLEALRNLGFNRVSLGVQDFDEKVQKAIHRTQSLESTCSLLEACKKLGFKSTNLDLIYGLPLQTKDSVSRTIDHVIDIRPSRIALYNYARLPEMIPHQKILEKYPMPEGEERVEIFVTAFEKLMSAGYVAIGMDHFALPDDSLAQAIASGTLHRNFQGYVHFQSTDLIGLGASAIGEVGDGYFQNEKKADQYEARIRTKELATIRGLLLTPEDRMRKWIIQRLMCRFELNFQEFENKFKEKLDVRFSQELRELDVFRDDHFLERGVSTLRVTALGRLFIRNIAMVFDAYLKAGMAPVRYSRTI